VRSCGPFRDDRLVVSGQLTGDLGTGSLSSDPNERCVADHGPFESSQAICRDLGGLDAGSRISFAPGYRTLGWRSLVLIRASSARRVAASAGPATLGMRFPARVPGTAEPPLLLAARRLWQSSGSVVEGVTLLRFAEKWRGRRRLAVAKQRQERWQTGSQPCETMCAWRKLWKYRGRRRVKGRNAAKHGGSSANYKSANAAARWNADEVQEGARVVIL
jgi:hypothetical protein